MVRRKTEVECRRSVGKALEGNHIVATGEYREISVPAERIDRCTGRWWQAPCLRSGAGRSIARQSCRPLRRTMVARASSLLRSAAAGTIDGASRPPVPNAARQCTLSLPKGRTALSFRERNGLISRRHEAVSARVPHTS